MGQSLFKTTGEYVPDKLIADNGIPVTVKGVKIAAGQGVLKRGTLLGAAPEGYKAAGSKEQDGEDGSESIVGCDCILADDVDAEKETIGTAYVTGTFNRDAVILAEGVKIEDYETELRKLGIFLRGVQDYGRRD